MFRTSGCVYNEIPTQNIIQILDKLDFESRRCIFGSYFFFRCYKGLNCDEWDEWKNKDIK